MMLSVAPSTTVTSPERSLLTSTTERGDSARIAATKKIERAQGISTRAEAHAYVSMCVCATARNTFDLAVQSLPRHNFCGGGRDVRCSDVLPQQTFHAPRRRRGKKHRLLCAEQRLKLWMNLAVKIPKIFAAMSYQRTRKCLPGFFRNFNWTGNEKLVVRMHEPNIRHPTSNIQC